MSKHTLRMSRRRLLGGALAGTALVPLLSAMPRALGQSGGPKRLVVLTWPNGVMQDDWWPSGGESDFSLRGPMAPLAPLRDRLLVLRGLEYRVQFESTDAAGHHSGNYMLNGVRGEDRAGADPIAGGISIDQVIARHIMETSPTRIPSLELNAYYTDSQDTQRAISFDGPPRGGRPAERVPEPNPYRVFDRLFGEGSGVGSTPDPRIEQLRRERRSVLDAALGDLDALGRRVPSRDRERLDAHASAIRALELELEASGPLVCAPPTLEGGVPQGENPTGASALPQNLRMQMDMLAIALACDQTRVATLQMVGPHNNGITFDWLGREFPDAGFGGRGDEYALRDHHDIAHNAGLSPEHRRRKNLVDEWFVKQAAYFCQRLDEMPEGDGTVLDHTAVVLWNVFEDGGSHGMRNLPVTIIGGCGGFFRTGRYLSLGATPHNRLLATLGQAMGLEMESFGASEYGGSLTGVS